MAASLHLQHCPFCPATSCMMLGNTTAGNVIMLDAHSCLARQLSLSFHPVSVGRLPSFHQAFGTFEHHHIEKSFRASSPMG